MKLIIAWIGSGALACLTLMGAETSGAPGDRARWEQSIVTLEISANQFDFFQPWGSQALNIRKAGLVIGKDEILTTADGLKHHTLIRVQKQGRGQWWNASLRWVDHIANIALITVAEDGFWDGLRPVSLSKTFSREGDIRIVRWNDGDLLTRKAEFSRFFVTNPGDAAAAHVVLELTAELDGAGSAEPAVCDGEMLGLIYGKSGNRCQLVPASFIQSVLDSHRDGSYRGLGYFDFTWQPTENVETLRYLGLPGEPRGVVVIEVPDKPGVDPVLRPRDILLEVDGFPVDIQGDYTDPEFGYLMLENLSTRHKWAGQEVSLVIWRDGERKEVKYVLPQAEDAARLVPEAPLDQKPEYLILGGLILQPLTRDYLRSWGGDWEQQAPFRLAYFRNEEPGAERPAVVILSQVLPDFYNLGYQDIRHLVLERVNGHRVSSLAEVVAAIAEPENGVHVLEFMKGESLQKIVLDAEELNTATQRVLQVYGIPKDRYLIAENAGE